LKNKHPLVLPQHQGMRLCFNLFFSAACKQHPAIVALTPDLPQFLQVSQM
jgi:hypothetical protein